METDFRPLSESEKQLLERMLDDAFPGRDELRRQLDSVTAKRINENGSLDLKVSSGPVAQVPRRVPTEAWCPDTDGMMIRLLLHVVEGTMYGLEIYKDDGSKIVRPPTASSLTLPPPGPG